MEKPLRAHLPRPRGNIFKGLNLFREHGAFLFKQNIYAFIYEIKRLLFSVN
jgi:hypothetical protein